MKIRNGFVSNSSSSSFIVARETGEKYESSFERYWTFAEIAITYKDLQKLLVLKQKEGCYYDAPDDLSEKHIKIIFGYHFLTDKYFREEYKEYVRYIHQKKILYYIQNVDNNSDEHFKLRNDSRTIYSRHR